MTDDELGTEQSELGGSHRHLDEELGRALRRHGFTGRIEAALEDRLGRAVDPELADLGRLLFFDNILGLHGDNSCAGCHAPANGFGDSQPIAIGVDNNGIVGKNRRGPRNQRRSPLVVNTAFYPALMWTARFSAISGDPFDSPEGFQFPSPENAVAGEPTLLAAQGSLPSTELVEMAGFTGITDNLGPFSDRFFQFDNGEGEALPAPDTTGFHNFPIQAAVDARLNANLEYRRLFGNVLNEDGAPLPEGGITISMRRAALAEFQISLSSANAPLDHFARGNRGAMTRNQKLGALLFFGKANCVACHTVSGRSNEMFSDFELHRVGGPQLAPSFGVGTGNVIFDGPEQDEDFGVEQTTGDPSLRYKFRTAPLRNLKVAPAFLHNGAFDSIADAIAQHLDRGEVARTLRDYEPHEHGVPADLQEGPFQPVLDAGIDHLLARNVRLSSRELAWLVDFVENALLDPRVLDFCELVPSEVPSGLPLAVFEGCE